MRRRFEFPHRQHKESAVKQARSFSVRRQGGGAAMRVKPTLKLVGAGATKGSVYLAGKKLPIHVPESISGSVEVRPVPVAGGGIHPSNGNGKRCPFIWPRNCNPGDRSVARQRIQYVVSRILSYAHGAVGGPRGSSEWLCRCTDKRACRLIWVCSRVASAAIWSSMQRFQAAWRRRLRLLTCSLRTGLSQVGTVASY